MKTKDVFSTFVFLALLTSVCWSLDPLAPGGFYCQPPEGSPLTNTLFGVLNGRTKFLWIVCAPDSGALLPIQNWSTDRDCCEVRPSRVMFPSTYTSPWWKDLMLDSIPDESFSRYYKDQSQSKWLPYGTVSTRSDSLIWLCDPDSQYRPDPPYTYKLSNPEESCYGYSGGLKFFRNIIEKVDDSVNFGDYDLDNDGHVDQIIFNIYGLAEEVEGVWRFQGTGGVALLAVPQDSTVVTQDTNALGETVRIGQTDGVTIWTPSSEAYTLSNPAWTPALADRETYWQTHNMAAHELGHALGFAHTPTGDGTGFGCFEPMGSQGSFREELAHPVIGRVLGPTSPYNTWYRQQKGWIDTILVDQTYCDFVLEDNLTSGKVLVVPADLRDTDQFFLMHASTRRRVWEVNYPSAGVIVWHVSPNADESFPSVSKNDMELSSGLFDWQSREEFVDPQWGCSGCVVRTGENLLTENTVSGRDSFDWTYRHVEGNYPQSMFDIGRFGSRGNYYRASDIFDYQSNPTSHGYASNISRHQTRKTMVHLDVTAVDSLTGTCAVNAWSRHWSGTLTTDAVWYDSVVVDGSVTIAAGATLTIEPGTKILVMPGTYLICYGQIDARGTVAQPILFQRNGGGYWGGIRIRSNDDNNRLEYVTINQAINGLVVSNGGRAHLNHVTASGSDWNGIAFANASGSISNCTMRWCNRRGLYLVNSAVTVSGNDIYGSGAIGVRLWGCNYTIFNANNVYNNGIQHLPQFEFWPGVQVLEGAVDLNCNTIEDNAGPGLMLLPQGYAYAGTNAGRNTFRDNMRALNELEVDYGQIYLQGGTIDIECGLNTIEDSSDANMLIRNYMEEMPPYSWNAEWNYWGTVDTANIRPRITWHPDIDPLLSLPWGCNPSNPLQCSLQEEDFVYREGWDRERAAQFAEAVSSYENYLDLYPRGKYSAVVADRLMFCKNAQAWSWSDIRTYFLDLAADSSKDSAVVTLCKANAAWCLIEMDEWDAGYAELDSLLNHQEKEYLQVTIALKKLLAELKTSEEELQSLPGDRGGSHGHGAGTIDETMETFDQKLARIDLEVDALLSRILGNPPQSDGLLLPRMYALYQNYPNPFNPLTEIHFDLPEQAHVELTIFNTLGQRVTTLVNAVRPAGTHLVSWDGSPVASGVYLYQLKAGDFVEAKKMVLLK